MSEAEQDHDAHVADWIGQSQANRDALLRLHGIADPNAYLQALRGAVNTAVATGARVVEWPPGPPKHSA